MACAGCCRDGAGLFSLAVACRPLARYVQVLLRLFALCALGMDAEYFDLPGAAPSAPAADAASNARGQDGPFAGL